MLSMGLGIRHLKGGGSRDALRRNRLE